MSGRASLDTYPETGTCTNDAGVVACALTLLIQLAEARGVPARRDAMFAGERINVTEDRAVLHIALRNRSGKPVLVDGADVMPEVDGVLARMGAFAAGVRDGRITATDGGAFTDVVNIGIGGSGSGAGDGGAGAGAVSRRAAGAFRLQRRRGTRA